MNRITNLRSLTGMSAVLGLAVLSTGAFAQFTAGNIVVSQIGNGTETLGTSGNSIILTEFSPSGAATGKSINLTAAAVAAGINFQDSANASSASRIKLSQNGKLITAPGYYVLPGKTLTGSIANSPDATASRVVAVADWANNTVDVSTVLTNAYDANGFRSAVTIDGSSFWLAGAGTATTGGILYATKGSTTAVQLSTTTTQNTRTVDIYAGRLYFTSASGSPTAFYGLNTFSSAALPTTSGQTGIRLTPTTVAANSNYDFFFATPTVVYIADDASTSGTGTGGVLKFINTGTAAAPTWTYEYTLKAGLAGTSGVSSVAGTTNPDGTVTLYGVSGTATGNKIVTIKDNLGDTTLPSTTFTAIATSGANTVYRGIVVLNPVTTGTISLQGVTDPTTTVIPVPPVSVRVKGTVTDFTQSVQLPSTGTYYLTNLSGNFGIGVKGDRQLQTVAPNVTIGGSLSFSLVAGDIAIGDGNGNYTPNNNVVDVNDLFDLLSAFNTLKGDGNGLYEVHTFADLDYNGNIDVNDLFALLSNFNVAGDTL